MNLDKRCYDFPDCKNCPLNHTTMCLVATHQMHLTFKAVIKNMKKDLRQIKIQENARKLAKTLMENGITLASRFDANNGHTYLVIKNHHLLSEHILEKDIVSEKELVKILEGLAIKLQQEKEKENE